MKQLFVSVCNLIAFFQSNKYLEKLPHTCGFKSLLLDLTLRGIKTISCFVRSLLTQRKRNAVLHARNCFKSECQTNHVFSRIHKKKQ